MKEMSKYSGLCETCDHDATCTLRRSSQLKIILCEEFVTQAAVSKPFHLDAAKASDPGGANGLGLCANCGNMATCGFPSARCNVLHCEEYILDESAAVPPVQSKYAKSAA